MKNSSRTVAVSAAVGALLACSPPVASRAEAPRPRTARPAGRLGAKVPATRPGVGRRVVPLGAARRVMPVAVDPDIPSPAVHPMASSRAEAAELQRLWTPARMRRAVPLDGIVALESRPPRAVRGGPPAETPATSPSTGAAWASGGKVVHTAGRVFFTYQGQPASCSGDAVTGANQSTVITAGHCVRLGGAWHKDWVFVPGYHDGQAPYGKWTARRTLTTPQWEAREALDYDVGAAVVAPLGGRTLTSVVGGQGIAFNQKRRRPMYAFGYPADTPYDGSRLVYCSGTVKDDTAKTHDLGLTCDMTAGSSGGPWFLRFDETTGTGIQNSVSSFKYDAAPTEMFGPYFGADAEALYHKAQNT